MSVDAKLMTVVSALKQSFEQSAGPGVSVNNHPNPFYVNVNGAIDLKHAATLILQRVEEFEASIKAKVEAEIKKLEAEAKALVSVAPTECGVGPLLHCTRAASVFGST